MINGVPVSDSSVFVGELLLANIAIVLQLGVGMSQKQMGFKRVLLIGREITIAAWKLLVVIKLKVHQAMSLLHVLLQRDIEPERLVTQLTVYKVDPPHDDGDGSVDDGDQLGVGEAVEVQHQLAVAPHHLHAHLAPEGRLPQPLLLPVTPHVRHKVRVPVAVEAAHVALEGRLVDDVPDVVEDEGLGVRVSEGAVVVVVGHEVLAVLVRPHPGRAGGALHQPPPPGARTLRTRVRLR